MKFKRAILLRFRALAVDRFILLSEERKAAKRRDKSETVQFLDKKIVRLLDDISIIEQAIKDESTGGSNGKVCAGTRGKGKKRG